MKFYFGLGKNYREAKKRGVDFQKTEHFAHSPLAHTLDSGYRHAHTAARGGREERERGGDSHRHVYVRYRFSYIE
jgi:uncharacterized DUF497 family protein